MCWDSLEARYTSLDMSIQNQDQLDGMTRAGKVVGETLAGLRQELRAGMTTAEVDALAGELLRAAGRTAGAGDVVGFPAAICVSVNEEAVHGLPGSRRLRAGDLVKLDVAAEVECYVADAAITVALPPVALRSQKLCDAADARAGARDERCASGHGGQRDRSPGRTRSPLARLPCPAASWAGMAWGGKCGSRRTCRIFMTPGMGRG